MDNEINNYRSEDVTVLWGGTYLTGLSDADIEVARAEDGVTQKAGLKGDIVRSISANRSGTVKVVLWQTSASLAMLRQDAQSDAEKTLVVRHAAANGGFIVNAERAMISKLPDIKVGKEAGTCEVVFLVPVLNVDEA